MNQLHEAYSILGLKPGSSKETILSRWKRLAMVWHPDRLPTEEGKKDAEEELKKINNAKDVLWKHFESGAHKASGCECQPGGPNQQQEQNTGQQKTGPGPGPKRKSHPDPEEEAKRRDAERQRRAAEEAASQQQQAQQQARQQSYQAAEQQETSQKGESLRWKVAKAEAIVFGCLCIFGWIGSGINAGIHSWQAEQERKAAQAAADEAKKNDPCQSGNTQAPPNFAQANINDAAMRTAKLWRTNCKGVGQGAIVTGEDERGQLVTALYYGPNLRYLGQYLVSYDSADKITAELWNAPNEFAGRTLYTYDASHNLIEIRKLDLQSQPLIIGTIERRPGGGFFAVDMQFIGENRTTKFYQSDDPQLAKNFELYEMFGKIAKQVDPAPTATSPDIRPAYVPTGDLTEHFKNRANPFAAPFSTPAALTPFSSPSSTSTTTSTTTDTTQSQTSTSTDEHLMPSPFSGTGSATSPTPAMDNLLKTLDKQNSKPQ